MFTVHCGEVVKNFQTQMKHISTDDLAPITICINWRLIADVNFGAYRVIHLKMEISNGFNFKTIIIWHYVGKVKMCFRVGSFFQFSKICLQFWAVCLQFFKKLPAFKHILALPTWGLFIYANQENSWKYFQLFSWLATEFCKIRV